MSNLIERQINDWQNRGVIDTSVADVLRKDINSFSANIPQKSNAKMRTPMRRFSFFQILIVFAAISFAAGVALLIASNWEAIPRFVRAAGVLSIIALGLLGGVFVHGRFGTKSKYAEEACYLIAGGAFLSAVALVAQMYHISGDERSAALLYTAGLGFGALAVRSLVLTGGALFFWVTWHLSSPDAGNIFSLPFWVFYAALCAVLLISLLLKSKWATWMVLFAALAGLLPLVTDVAWWVLQLFFDGIDWFYNLPDQNRLITWCVLLAVMCFGLMLPDAKKECKAGFLRRHRVGLCFTIGCIALIALHEFVDEGLVSFAIAALVIGFVLLTLYRHGKEHRLVRYCCYAVFLVEVFFLYTVTISSMISTSGFLMLLAVFLIGVATFVYRLEKRFSAASTLKEEV
ncbi:DUF2157 domain-containing protein [Ahrensia kielensis]|uniref:DUF2157 domain-containing protein n=1 Tax=Ahrensia kielensis TaxID=76980 RepID=A0ABU9T5M6_9HYPH